MQYAILGHKFLPWPIERILALISGESCANLVGKFSKMSATDYTDFEHVL